MFYLILGLILSFVNLSEPATLGKGLSTALLGLLYGTLLGVSSLSLQAPFERTALARTGPAPAGSTIHAGFSILFAATCVAFVLAAFFTVMYATAPSCP